MRTDDQISRRLKLRDLHYLLTVVQAGSMAKAAPLLGVTQPVLSKVIADLEFTLGVRLLDRSPRGVTPSPYGRALLASSHAVFDELRQGIKELEFLRDPTTGDLFLGANEASMCGIVPEIIDRMRLEHPLLRANVLPTNTSLEQQRELRERNIEFAIGRISGEIDTAEFETDILFDQQLLVIAGAQNPLTRRSHVKLRDLIDEPWILPNLRSVAGQLVVQAFHDSGLPVPKAKVVTSSFQLNFRLLEDGPFLGLMSGSVLPAVTRNSLLRRVKVDLPSKPAPVGIIKLRNRTLGPVAKIFIDMARQTAASTYV